MVATEEKFIDVKIQNPWLFEIEVRKYDEILAGISTIRVGDDFGSLGLASYHQKLVIHDGRVRLQARSVVSHVQGHGRCQNDVVLRFSWSSLALGLGGSAQLGRLQAWRVGGSKAVARSGFRKKS